MTENEIVAIATRFIGAWNAGGAGVVDELAAPDIVVSYTHFPTPIYGAERLKAILNQTHASFPDMQIRIDDMVAGVEGEVGRAVVAWTYIATHMQGELYGVSPGGRSVRVSGITMYRIVAGRVVEERGVSDNLSLLLQLGAVTLPQ
ncbi:MAG TPA: ester cyclase [Chloroflexi bacterium]|jgi:steroid delta-isomerase-like uncharacterized protein|nr:ester cyclase [Chloroflexota bacterium]